MLKVTTDRTPYYAGKPNAQIVKMCMEQVGAKPEEVTCSWRSLTRTLHVELTREWKRLLCIQGEAKPEDLVATEFMPGLCI